MKDIHEERENAILIGTYQDHHDKALCEDHIDELERLVDTFGANSIEKVSVHLRKVDPSIFIGTGKLEELVLLSKEKQAQLIIFDDEILPSQQRNLEKAFNLPVLDRTEVILDVFAQHAHSNEAKLQIELAKVQYQLPRLKRMWTHLSRQRGGGVNLKGEGEKQIELDKRMLRQRQDKLMKDLKEVLKHRKVMRAERERSGIPTIAIVGYTNAGKSSLLNALTEAEVLVEDKLFATLDTTTRKFVLPNDQPILLSDTVGFVRKLPHNLVAAFRSTLEEAVFADILIHLVDVSNPMFAEHIEATYELLEELGVKDKPIITACNKIDMCADLDAYHRISMKYPKTVAISVKNREGFEELLHLLTRELQDTRVSMQLRIPQEEYQLIHQLREHGQVTSQDYEENDILVQAEVDKQYYEVFANYLDPQ
jgi:GTP-binding protein HflX